MTTKFAPPFYVWHDEGACDNKTDTLREAIEIAAELGAKPDLKGTVYITDVLHHVVEDDAYLIEFDDQGRDFLHWAVQGGRVVETWQAWMWLGVRIVGTPEVGGRVSFIRDGENEVRHIKYPVVKITRLV